MRAAAQTLSWGAVLWAAPMRAAIGRGVIGELHPRPLVKGGPRSVRVKLFAFQLLAAAKYRRHQAEVHVHRLKRLGLAPLVMCPSSAPRAVSGGGARRPQLRCGERAAMSPIAALST